MDARQVNTQFFLEKATELHQQGDLSGAEQQYEKVLSIEPSHFLALANIGAIHLLNSQWLQAETYIRLALKVNSNSPVLYGNLGVALKAQGKLQEAIYAYQQAVKFKPTYTDAYHSLGIVYSEMGLFEKATMAFQKTLDLTPNNPEIYHDLGVMFFKQGDLEKATLAYRKALQLNPQYHQASYNLGIVAKTQEKFEEAITNFHQAIDLAPDFPEGYHKLGYCYAATRRYDEAAAAYQQAIAIQPKYVEAYLGLGLIYQEQGDTGLAIKYFREALAINPQCAEAYSNLGLIFKAKNNYQAAIPYFLHALAVRPDFPEAHYNLGLVYHQMGLLAEAVSSYEKAITVKPQYPSAHLGLGIAKLLLDDYDTGWREYAWRLQLKENSRNLPGIQQLDQVFEGNHEIILVEEQGIGDIFQFMRYGKLLKAYFPLVSLAARQPICDLIASTGIFDKIYPLPAEQLEVSENARWIPILSLPKLLGVTRTNPLLQEPYIKTSFCRADKWQDKILGSDLLTVGINWQGNPETEKDDFQGRSFQLSEYEPLATIPGGQFVSLQKGYGSEQWETCTFKEQFVACQEEINATWEWVETAAIVQSCDLIITSDTSIAHLAGAMGKPVWILLKKIPDWRWGLEEETCPWYPSARLFRQTEDGNWTEVMQRVKDALQEFVQEYAELAQKQ